MIKFRIILCCSKSGRKYENRWIKYAHSGTKVLQSQDLFQNKKNLYKRSSSRKTFRWVNEQGRLLYNSSEAA